jgi:hypothetical protein
VSTFPTKILLATDGSEDAALAAAAGSSALSLWLGSPAAYEARRFMR